MSMQTTSFAKQCRTAFLMLLMIACVCSNPAHANTGDKHISAKIISGRVTDSATGAGLVAVTIHIKGTKTTVITDTHGNYSVEADNNATLVFSFVGYTTQEI